MRVDDLFESVEIFVAVVLQNSLHKLNSNRTEAIKTGSYVEFMSLEQAREYIDSQTRLIVLNKLRNSERIATKNIVKKQRDS